MRIRSIGHRNFSGNFYVNDEEVIKRKVGIFFIGIYSDEGPLRYFAEFKFQGKDYFYGFAPEEGVEPNLFDFRRGLEEELKMVADGKKKMILNSFDYPSSAWVDFESV